MTENETTEVDKSYCKTNSELDDDNESILKHFKKISTLLTWSSARDNCEAIGGRLYDDINFITNGERDELYSMFESNSGSLWFGLWSPANSDKWETTTGEIFLASEISAWYPGDPNGPVENKMCAQVFLYNYLADTGCQRETKSVCKMVD